MAFAGYRRLHPAAILGYYEPYKPAATCVAFIHARERHAAVWRKALRDLDKQVDRLVREWPTSNPHSPRWAKATRKIELLWRALAAADPFAASTRERMSILRDLLTVAVDTAVAIDPESDQVAGVTRMIADLTRLLDPAG